MARSWTVSITDFSELATERTYAMRVVEVARTKLADSKGQDAMRVTIEHLDPSQQGRRHEVDLPLPIRPQGLASDLLRACGLEPNVGLKVAPKTLIGSVVLVRFAACDGGWRVSAFEQANEEELPSVSSPPARQPDRTRGGDPKPVSRSAGIERHEAGTS